MQHRNILEQWKRTVLAWGNRKKRGVEYYPTIAENLLKVFRIDQPKPAVHTLDLANIEQYFVKRVA